jgi:hypothetical protein
MKEFLGHFIAGVMVVVMIGRGGGGGEGEGGGCSGIKLRLLDQSLNTGCHLGEHVVA